MKALAVVLALLPLLAALPVAEAHHPAWQSAGSPGQYKSCGGSWYRVMSVSDEGYAFVQCNTPYPYKSDIMVMTGTPPNHSWSVVKTGISGDFGAAAGPYALGPGGVWHRDASTGWGTLPSPPFGAQAVASDGTIARVDNGAAMFAHWTGSAWVSHTVTQGPTAWHNSGYNGAVKLSNDGQWAIVQTTDWEAWVYQRVGNTWTPTDTRLLYNKDIQNIHGGVSIITQHGAYRWNHAAGTATRDSGDSYLMTVLSHTGHAGFQNDGRLYTRDAATSTWSYQSFGGPSQHPQGDFSGNGYSFFWYGPSPPISEPKGDFDHDGHTNGDEQAAGCNAGDASSRPATRTARYANGDELSSTYCTGAAAAALPSQQEIVYAAEDPDRIAQAKDTNGDGFPEVVDVWNPSNQQVQRVTVPGALQPPYDTGLYVPGGAGDVVVKDEDGDGVVEITTTGRRLTVTTTGPKWSTTDTQTTTRGDPDDRDPNNPYPAGAAMDELERLRDEADAFIAQQQAAANATIAQLQSDIAAIVADTERRINETPEDVDRIVASYVAAVDDLRANATRDALALIEATITASDEAAACSISATTAYQELLELRLSAYLENPSAGRLDALIRALDDGGASYAAALGACVSGLPAGDIVAQTAAVLGGVILAVGDSVVATYNDAASTGQDLAEQIDQLNATTQSLFAYIGATVESTNRLTSVAAEAPRRILEAASDTPAPLDEPSAGEPGDPPPNATGEPASDSSSTEANGIRIFLFAFVGLVLIAYFAGRRRR